MSIRKAADLHAEMDRMVPIAVCISPQFKKSLSECNCKKKETGRGWRDQVPAVASGRPGVRVCVG